MTKPALESVLFCCTGNIFRSMTAEYALRRELQRRGLSLRVSSAGTQDVPRQVLPYVRDHLQGHGLDVSAHARRTMTRPLLEDGGLVIAMSTEHQSFLRSHFGHAAPLFLELCSDADGGTHALPDVDEAVPDYLINRAAAEDHIRLTIDRIIELTPRLANSICGQWVGSTP